MSADRNLPARWALTLPLLALVLVPVFVGIRVSGVLGAAGTAVALIIDVLALAALIAGIPFGIVGLVRAARIARGGQIARGRPHAIIGIVICVLLLVGNSVTAVRLLDIGSAAQRTANQSTLPTAGATAPAQAPIGATPEDGDGTTSYVYSQSLTESAITSAIVQRVHITPGSVQCPTSELIVIGTTFDCSVALPAAGTTSVEVTVVSDQGELEISAG
ncbi:hypothetical protein AX769_18555 [Frondihabitans sp. PAMC 28766]|uniref:hypothetical protein n=1 Tax=Frondihabitans sp. PAMC 28766 TaxID=1795630 RepID=UPI00078C0C51|nr:hypothetical protein [Frondihabitans sp. PAMC 28766]AMM21784.1 hypothetical protein AX769_18555 [Frondihabitans sp. PAMC 28766]